MKKNMRHSLEQKIMWLNNNSNNINYIFKISHLIQLFQFHHS